MASDRMIEAIRTLERAIVRLEQEMEGISAATQPASQPCIDPARARAALRSLDELIAELKGQERG